MPKAPPKPLKKKPPKDGEVHERMRQASKPNKRSKKPTDQRMREASRPQRRRKMTDQAQQGNNQSASAQGAPRPTGNKAPGTEQRGAGSGADANATRTRSLVDWPPPPKTHAEHVEELLEQAQINEDYNNAVNEAQTAVAAGAREVIGDSVYPLDAKGEEESRAQVLEDFKNENDPAEKKKRLKGEMDARAKRDKAQADAMYAK
jgi:hypothetical protein